MVTSRKKSTPRKYDRDFFVSRIEELRAQGRGLDAIAEKLGLSPTTLRSWKRRYPEVKEALDSNPGQAGRESEYCANRHANKVRYLLITRGASVQEICDDSDFGISEQTFRRWCREHPEFGEAVQQGRALICGRLLGSALKQSLEPNTIVEEKIEWVRQKVSGWHEGSSGPKYEWIEVRKTTSTKTMPPDSDLAWKLLQQFDPQNFRRDAQGEMLPPAPREKTEAEQWAEDVLSKTSFEDQVFLDKALRDRPDIEMRYRRTGDKSEMIRYLNDLRNGTAPRTVLQVVTVAENPTLYPREDL